LDAAASNAASALCACPTSAARRLSNEALTGRSLIGRTIGTRGSIASAARGCSEG
jgi:hypothetical protein